MIAGRRALLVRKHSGIDCGFTLLEVLVALSIFSFIALAGFRLLHSTARLTDAGQLATAQTLAYKKAVNVIASDLRNTIDRSEVSLTPGVSGQIAFKTGQDTLLEFSRGAYGPSSGAARSDAIRVRYLLRNEDKKATTRSVQGARFTLVRQISAMDGHDRGVEREQLLLRDVDSATVRFMDKNGHWHGQWPFRDENSSQVIKPSKKNAGDKQETIPRAVELNIQTSIPSGPLLIAIRD